VWDGETLAHNTILNLVRISYSIIDFTQICEPFVLLCHAN
jgi:hypothetical protein